jgi:hypothetical protein
MHHNLTAIAARILLLLIFMLKILEISSIENLISILYSRYSEWGINACTKIFFLNFIVHYSYEINSGHIPYLTLILSNVILLGVIFLLRKPTNQTVIRRNVTAIAMSFEIIQLGLLIGLILSWLYHSFLYYEIISSKTLVSRLSGDLSEGVYHAFVVVLPLSFWVSLISAILLNFKKRILSVRLFNSVVLSFVVATAISIIIMGVLDYLKHPSFTPKEYANHNVKIEEIAYNQGCQLMISPNYLRT